MLWAVAASRAVGWEGACCRPTLPTGSEGPCPAVACVLALTLLPRAWLPHPARSATAGGPSSVACLRATSSTWAVQPPPACITRCGASQGEAVLVGTCAFVLRHMGGRLGSKRRLQPSMHASLCATPATACPWVMLLQEGVSFHDTRDKLVPRPWVVDDLDALLDRLCRCAHVLCCVWRCGRDNYMQDGAGGLARKSTTILGGQSALSASERRGGTSCAAGSMSTSACKACKWKPPKQRALPQ